MQIYTMQYTLLNINPVSDNILLQQMERLIIQSKEIKNLKEQVLNKVADDDSCILNYSLNLINLNQSHHSISEKLQELKFNQLLLLSNSIFAAASLVYVSRVKTKSIGSHQINWLTELPIINELKPHIHNLNVEFIANTYPYSEINKLFERSTKDLKVVHLKKLEHTLIQQEAKCFDIVRYGVSALLNSSISNLWKQYKDILADDYPFNDRENYISASLGIKSLFDKYPLSSIL